METALKGWLLLLVLVLAVADPASGQGVCPRTFYSALLHLAPCRSAVSPFRPIPPSEACCTALRWLGQPCFCFVINGPVISGLDHSLAIQLPDKCIVDFEPCDAGL